MAYVFFLYQLLDQSWACHNNMGLLMVDNSDLLFHLNICDVYSLFSSLLCTLVIWQWRTCYLVV